MRPKNPPHLPPNAVEDTASTDAESDDELTALRRERDALAAQVSELSLFREVVEHLPLGVGVWAATGRTPGDMTLLYVNDRAALEWGDAFARRVGQTVREAVPEALSAPAPFNLPVMWHRVALSATPEVIDPLPYGAPHAPDGWLRVHCVPAGPKRAAMVFDNISRHVRTERELQHVNRELEHRVHERTERLDELNRELTSFSHTVSHDLRAPLRSVSGFAEALLEDFGDALPEEARDYVNRILGSAEVMNARIEGLLVLSRISQTRLMKEKVHLSIRVEKVWARLTAHLDATRAVELVLEHELCVVADPRLVDALLENLLGNALKYTHGTDPSRIQFGRAYARQGWAFFVADDGVGFDPQHAELMFRPFQRLHRSEAFAGSGIGLATVQRIATMHGGRVWSTVNAEGGATVWFTL